MPVIITVIIPCYNAGSYLTEAVGSVLDNTFQDVKIIVVDDGSTDQKTLAMLRSLERKEKVEVIHHPHHGVAAARNLGARHTQSKYLAVVDADDLISHDYLEKCLHTLHQNEKRDPRVGFVYTDFILFGSLIGFWRVPQFNLYELLYYHFLPAPALMKKEVWEQAGGYDEALPNLEDLDFWLSVLERGWVGKKAEGGLYFYRQHSKQTRARHRLHRSPREFYRLLGTIRRRHSRLYQKAFIESAKRDWARSPKDWWRIQLERLYMAIFPFVPRSLVNLILRKELRLYLKRFPHARESLPLEVRHSIEGL